MKDIDELDRLHAAAWGGPWTAETWDVCLHDCETILAPEAYPDGQVVAQVSHADGRIVAPGLEQFAAANTAAIVALHNAWPDVSARLRAAEAEVERLQREVESLAALANPQAARDAEATDSHAGSRPDKARRPATPALPAEQREGGVSALAAWSALVEQINGRVSPGQPGVRDPENTCEAFDGLGYDGRGSCKSDGHYLCAECSLLSPEASRFTERDDGRRDRLRLFWARPGAAARQP